MAAKAWRNAIVAAVRWFEQSRNVSRPVVTISLHDGETFDVAAIYSHGEEFVLLDPYPPDPEREMIGTGEETLPQSPRLVLVRPEYVRKVEISIPAQPKEAFGFHPPPAEDAAATGRARADAAHT